MIFKYKKRILLWSILLISSILVVWGYFWLTCRNYCKSFLTQNYYIVILAFQDLLKKSMMVIILFVVFRIIQKVIIDKSLKKFMEYFYTEERYKSLQKIVKFIFWLIFLFIILSVLIDDFSTLIASLGLIGFGLTFALQKPILNFVGWLTILFKNIYSEGDRIKVGDFVGDVKEIHIMNTILDGLLESSDLLSGKTISFPNEMVLTGEVQNYLKDGNYIVNELAIDISYESDYKRAMTILKEIILEQVVKNQVRYIKKINRKKKELAGVINHWIKSDFSDRTKEKDEIMLVENLKKEKEIAENKLEELEEEFIPKIRLEMKDSAIQLVAQFKSPYDEIKKNRTEINIAFLNKVKNEPNIDIAYPHLQLVSNDSKNVDSLIDKLNKK